MVFQFLAAYFGLATVGINLINQNETNSINLYKVIYIGTREYRLGRMIMSHVVSDNIDELHAFAKQIGIEKHFQDKDGKPHYDISKAYKAEALKMDGVIEVNDREIISVLKKLKL